MGAIGTMKHLTNLYLTNCKSVSDDGLVLLFQGDPENAANLHGNKIIKELDLTGCTQVSDEGFRAVAASV